jgi:phosphoribosyl 1,2-cyclic phosphodiesterase
MIRVRFWGTRGSIASPGPATQHYGGNTPCVQLIGFQNSAPGAAVHPRNPHVILDGGTGLLSLQESLMTGPWGNGQGELHFLLSHDHWDHIIGIPFFKPMFKRGNRIVFYGPSIRDLQASVERLFTSVYSPLKGAHNVEADLVYRRLDPSGTKVTGFQVRAAQNRHPGGALSFRIQYGAHGVVYSSDHAAGDSQIDAGLVALAKEADLWILNAMFTQEEQRQYRGWGQSSHVEAVKLAVEASVGTVVLFHHDPWKDDKSLDQMGLEASAVAAGTGTDVLMARDGMVVEIGKLGGHHAT